MDFSSFLTSLGTSFLLFVILMLLFTWLSRKPGNEVIYYPNRILRGLDPYDGTCLTRNPLSWIREAVSSTEADVIEASGVDTAVYFVFLTTVLGIFVLAGVFLLPICLPIAGTAHGVIKTNDSTSQGTFDDLDKLSMGHIEQGSPRLWAFVVATYWVSIVVYVLLWKAYRHASNLRASALMTSDVKSEQFAVVVRDIPSLSKGRTRKDQIDSYFRAIYPDAFHRSLVVTDNGKANKIYQELEGYRKKLERAEFVFEETKTASKPEGHRPETKTGFLGLVGKKVDAIEHYEERIKKLNAKLEAEQKATLRKKQGCAAVIFFNSRATAASAAQSLHGKVVDSWTVMDAPQARDLLWGNLTMNYYMRMVRQYIIYFVVFLTVFFYMIPIGIISAFTTLDHLVKLLPFIKPVVEIVEIKTVLEAYLPQIALIVFLAMLPKFLLFLSKAEGIPSESHAQRAASGKYFYFSVLNVFIGVTIGSSLFTTLKTVQKNTDSVIPLLARSLPGSATFFLTFVALKFFVGYGLELSRIVPLIIFHLKKRYMCKTEAEVREAWAPDDLGYATRIPEDMLVFTIVICYSIIAPLIIPFGALYFGLGWVLLRNQALKVYVPAYETYGKMWPHIYVRMVSSLILYQLTMLGYFGVKEFVYGFLLIPLPIISFVYVYVCQNKFSRFFHATALELACREVKEEPDMDSVFESYVPPCLRSEKKSYDGDDEDAFSRVSSRVSNF